MSKGRKAQGSVEKPSVYDAIKDDDRVLHTPAGSAVGKEMKKDLFKLMHLVKTT